MILKLWEDSANREILIWQSLPTREIQELVTTNWLSAPTRTVCTEFKLNIWCKECHLSFGREFFLQKTNIENRSLIKLWAARSQKANNLKRLLLQSKHLWKLSWLWSWWPFWKKSFFTIANSRSIRSFRIFWSSLQLNQTNRGSWTISTDLITTMVPKWLKLPSTISISCMSKPWQFSKNWICTMKLSTSLSPRSEISRGLKTTQKRWTNPLFGQN